MENRAQVRLVFAGELVEGHSRDEVKRLFGELFKLEGDRLAAVFSGQRTVLKRSIGHVDGERYISRLRKIGMRVVMEPLDAWPDLMPLGEPDEPAAPVVPPPRVSPPPPPTVAAAPVAAPVATAPTLVPLEEEVTCPNCGGRQPKRFVLCRSCNSDIPRALAAKQEDADRAMAERLAARQGGRQGGRFAPPKAEVGGAYNTDVVEAPATFSMSFDGRLGRLSYFNAGFVTLGMVGLLAVAMGGLFAAGAGGTLLMPMLAGFVLLVVWNVRFSVLRLHDINLNGWWAALMVVPGFNNLLALALLLWPGTKGDNNYGAQPRQGNGLVAVAMGVLMVLVLAMSYSTYQRYARMVEADQNEESEPSEAMLPQQAVRYLPTQAAQDAFTSEYMPAADNKVFASSPRGGWGWSGGKLNLEDAAREALASCDLRREPYTPPCRVINVNGGWPRER